MTTPDSGIRPSSPHLDGGARPATILIVDDDAASRLAVEQLFATQPRLRELNARVVKAIDGNRALAVVQSERPDLVITELSIPGMDGFAFCREVRKVSPSARVPILIVSGVPMDANLVAEMTKELAATFLPKPVQPDLLADAIVAAVSGTGVRGALADRSVSRLLFDHLEAGSTGTLLLVRGQMRKEVFLRRGEVVAADSNLRQEALGSLLLSKAIIDEQQLKFLLAETKRRQQKMGTVLVELGWLGPDEIIDYLAAQARKRVVDCLRWPDGSWSFVPGDAFAERVIEHQLDAARLIFKGLLKSALPEDLLVTLERDGGRRVHLSPRIGRWRADFEAIFGTALLPILQEGGTLGSLILRDDGQGLAMAIETLLASGFAELGAPEEEPAPPLPAPRESIEALTLERLGSNVSGRFRALMADPAGDTWNGDTTSPDLQIFNGEKEGVVGAPAGSSESGKVEFGHRPGTQPGIGPGGRNDGRNALLREFLELHGKSHYEVLGVPPTATEEEVAVAHRRRSDRLTGLFVELRGETVSASDVTKLEALRAAYDRALEALSDPLAREGYDTAQVTPLESGVDALGAELAFGEGRTLLDKGKPDEAAERFAAAVEGRPDQAEYHAYFGWALFMASGVAEAHTARDRLNHALTLDPDLSKAHELLGRLAVSEADDVVARGHLERALELEPTQPDLLELLVTVHARLDDHRGSEKFYRRLIALLGERGLTLRARLWRALGDLYEGRLADKESARIAYENAARLSPADVGAQRKVLELNGTDLQRWRESARALGAEWSQHPDDADIGRRLMTLFLKAERHDAATITAAALMVRNLANEEARLLAEEGRPRLLRRLATPMDPSIVRRLAAAGEDEEVETMVGLLAGAGVIPCAPLEGTTSVQAPAACKRVLKYLCDLLEVPEPTRFARDERMGRRARLGDDQPATLVMGPALLATNDTVELGFRLTRALASARPGRAVGMNHTGRELRPYFVAALAVARGATNLPDLESELLSRRIGGLPASVRNQLVEVGGRLQRGRRAVNLSGWTKALGRTAERLALVVSADLLRAGRAIADEDGAEAVDDLLAFALSIEHLELREELGLAAVI
jgi:DNA-binding NarL/FixJ family response regulator/tetratricopeptide (TPR) repeat protein